MDELNRKVKGWAKRLLQCCRRDGVMLSGPAPFLTSSLLRTSKTSEAEKEILAKEEVELKSKGGHAVAGCEKTDEKNSENISTLSCGSSEERSPRVTIDGIPDVSPEEQAKLQKLFGLCGIEFSMWFNHAYTVLSYVYFAIFFSSHLGVDGYCLVAMASVLDKSKKPLKVLQLVPTYGFCLEVRLTVVHAYTVLSYLYFAIFFSSHLGVDGYCLVAMASVLDESKKPIKVLQLVPTYGFCLESTWTYPGLASRLATTPEARRAEGEASLSTLGQTSLHTSEERDCCAHRL
ncbi:hypothetical protein J6590_095432 [Homalodisca vitripennis]|nr:hypothetical protein J6590_095432 [Homalodisca vitripennis]